MPNRNGEANDQSRDIDRVSSHHAKATTKTTLINENQNTQQPDSPKDKSEAEDSNRVEREEYFERKRW